MMPDLTRCEESGIIFFTDDGLFDRTGVRIAFTTRYGGISSSPFDSMNLADHVGDDPACVSENRRMVMEAIDAGRACASLANPDQVHGTDVWRVSEEDPSLMAIGADLSQAVADKVEADAVLVEEPGIAAMLCYADCVPLILVSDSGRFAVVHAGWRGLIGGIVEKAVRELRRSDGMQEDDCVRDDRASECGSSDAHRIYAYIGPCIRKECFEVSPKVAERFVAAYGQEVASEDHVDLPMAMRKALADSGIPREDIEDLQVCTACDQAFYSYRESGGETGRHAAIAFKAP